ncbi:MAG TPA: class I SAM-dependent methyltransferase [Solirubrobacteraceae bacterium]|nr:class I SAM-dependent methyltransferase [Solirubrobacteraceae bacterium]
MLTAQQIEWHRDQFTAPKRSVVKLAEFVTRVMAGSEPPAEVLDAGTGAGANMLHLAGLFPDARWTGTDMERDLVDIGSAHLDPERFSVIEGDLANLEADHGAKAFDVCFSIQVLSVIEDYERALEQMIAVTRDWVFILSLFSDTELDAFIRVMGRMDGPSSGLEMRYNVYSLARFRELCMLRGARAVLAEPFEIDIDLPRPEHGGMGTWTRRTADGERLQISGPLLMPWWFVAVAM